MDTLNHNRDNYGRTFSPLAPPNNRSRPYPAKAHILLQEIKWHFLPSGNQKFCIPDSDSVVSWIYREYIRRNRNYKPVEIFYSVQECWLSQSFGACQECVQIFAKLITSIFPQEYGFNIKPSKKYCGHCQKIKPLEDFKYSYAAKTTKKKRFCKTCESILNSPKAQINHPAPELTREQQEAEILNQLLNPRPSAQQLDTLDADPDFSSDRLGDLE